MSQVSNLFSPKPRLIAILLRYGNKFVKRCQSYLHAEEEAVELLISIESNWVKIETQIEIVKRIAAGLSKKLQDMQCHVLSQLEGKLKTAIVMIEQLRSEKRENKVAKMDKRKHDDMDITIMMAGLQGMKTSKKVKYVTKKNALYEIVHEIEKWQARYDPTWILIMQMSIGSIDEELHKEQKRPEHEQIPIIVAARGIRDAARATQDEKLVGRGPIWIDQIDLSPLRILHSPVQCSTVDDEKKTILIDTMVTDPAADPDRTAQAVRNLARILSEVDPSVFGLLKCRGVIKDAIENAAWSPCPNFHFIFEVPPDHTNPQSLRSLLLSGTSYPLDERLELAKRLTSSILFVHTVQFVHKNIRPETIIVFQNQHSCIGAPFLAGFEQFRVVDGHSGRVGDDQWQRNLCNSSFHLPPHGYTDESPARSSSISSRHKPSTVLRDAARYFQSGCCPSRNRLVDIIRALSLGGRIYIAHSKQHI